MLTKHGTLEQRYIGIVDDNSTQRKSTLMVTKRGELQVIGELPHSYRFKPETKADALKLVKYFQEVAAEME